MAIDTSVPRTRRAILLGALGGAAASVAATLSRANPVSATSGAIVHVGGTYSATGPTEIDASGSASAAIVGVNDSGYGLWGNSNTGVGVQGNSHTHPGLRGWSYGNSAGVLGFSSSGAAALPAAPAKTGVYGEANQGSAAIGLCGRSDAGTGVYGTSPNGKGIYGDSNTGSGLYGLSNAADVAATIGRSVGESTGVQGFSGAGDLPAAPNHTGVYGSAPTGRGGQFAGGKAQLRLVPSALLTHPTSGSLGDLFLDKNKRLWFCKGGTTWKQIA